MNETIPEKKDNWFVAFFKAIWASSFGKIDSSKATKINAAFGTMLLAVLVGFGVPLAEWLFANFSNTWAVFLIGGWEAFAIFFGITIIVIFGTTQVVEAVNTTFTAKDIEAMITTAVEVALNKFIANNKPTPVPTPKPEPEPIPEPEPEPVLPPAPVEPPS